MLIHKRDAFQVVCKRKRVDKPQSANATPDITAMWQEYGANGTMGRLIACMPENPVMKGLLGICFSSELNAKQFPYGIGVEYDGRKVDDDLEIVTISANTYAVFTSKGKMPDAFIIRSSQNFSRRAHSMNMRRMWSLRFTHHRMSQIRITSARSGSR